MPHKSDPQSQNGDSGRRPPIKIAISQLPSDRRVCCVCANFAKEAWRILPHMTALVCLPCAAKPGCAPVNEYDVSNKSFPPWNEQELSMITAYQFSNIFLPFVCDADHLLVAKRDSLICERCVGFEVTWVYTWMLDMEWRMML